MLIVKTYLEQKNGHIGVFAAQEIIPYQTVIKSDPMLDRWFYHQQIQEGKLLDFFSRYGIYDEERASWHLFGDNGRFLSQSRKPNVQKKGFNFYAVKKIELDEELTLDYTQTCDWVRRFGLKVKFNGQAGQKILQGIK